MLPWEGLLAYFLILVAAAILGWLPFRVIEYVSLVHQLDAPSGARNAAATSSRVACLGCGQLNDPSYAYCGSCGKKLLADER